MPGYANGSESLHIDHSSAWLGFQWKVNLTICVLNAPKSSSFSFKEGGLLLLEEVPTATFWPRSQGATVENWDHGYYWQNSGQGLPPSGLGVHWHAKVSGKEEVKHKNHIFLWYIWENCFSSSLGKRRICRAGHGADPSIDCQKQALESGRCPWAVISGWWKDGIGSKLNFESLKVTWARVGNYNTYCFSFFSRQCHLALGSVFFLHEVEFSEEFCFGLVFKITHFHYTSWFIAFWFQRALSLSLAP